MNATKATAIRRRFVRRFSYPHLNKVEYYRGQAWRTETPEYFDRESMTVGRVPSTRAARRFWAVLSVDKAVR